MNIGYCTLFDPLDKKSWSGTNYFVMKALETYCGKIIHIGPIYTRYIFIGKILAKLSRYILRKEISYFHLNFISRKLAKILHNRIESKDLDILFFCAGSELLSFFESKLPVIYLSDATFQALVDYHQHYTNLFDFSKRMGNTIERNAIQKADRIIYASEWAAKSAVEYYGCDKNKFRIIPFGANLNFIPSYEVIEKRRQVDQSVLRLLFIGVDWERKGGQIAFDTMVELNNRGIDTELILIGCVPPKKIANKKLKVVGFLDKNNPEDEIKLNNYFMESSFLLFPTRNECAGIVSCESSAYGLPVISTQTGGVPSYVENTINGYLLPIDAGYNKYADIIQGIWSDKKRYYELCMSSRNRYENRLNWDSWGEEVLKLIKDIN